MLISLNCGGLGQEEALGRSKNSRPLPSMKYCSPTVRGKMGTRRECGGASRTAAWEPCPLCKIYTTFNIDKRTFGTEESINYWIWLTSQHICHFIFHQQCVQLDKNSSQYRPGNKFQSAVQRCLWMNVSFTNIDRKEVLALRSPVCESEKGGP